jgi:hypothetical protein
MPRRATSKRKSSKLNTIRELKGIRISTCWHGKRMKKNFKKRVSVRTKSSPLKDLTLAGSKIFLRRF